MRETSRAAAVSIHENVEQMRFRVLATIRDTQGATCDEVEVLLRFRHQTASARIRELTLEGSIRDSGKRRNTRSGRKAIVWEVGESSLSSPLKWAGSKRWLVPRLRDLYTPYHDRRLVEPFVGGMSVALGLQPERALLMDINQALVWFYQRVRYDASPFTIAMENDEAFYYKQRERFNELIVTGEDDEQFVWCEAGELFYYLNRTCFNGLCRTNRAGKFNVPFGKYKTINYRRDFSEYTAVFKNWQIECGGFGFTSTLIEPGDFVFLDPPYDCDFVDYSKDGFAWEQQIAVAEKFAAHNGPVIATNAATARILNLYGRLGYKVDLVAAPRSIAANGDRGDALEMFATKNLTQ